MKTGLVKIITVAVFALFCSASLSYAQDSTKSKSGEHEKEMKKEMHVPSGKMDKKSGMNHGMMMDMKGMKHESSAELDSSVIRKGEIDLTAIDENKDGKVYQCPMDFDVLSDKPGTDPKCGMKLEEVSLEKAKENLISHGYKVK